MCAVLPPPPSPAQAQPSPGSARYTLPCHAMPCNAVPVANARAVLGVGGASGHRLRRFVRSIFTARVCVCVCVCMRFALVRGAGASGRVAKSVCSAMPCDVVCTYACHLGRASAGPRSAQYYAGLQVRVVRLSRSAKQNSLGRASAGPRSDRYHTGSHSGLVQSC